MNKENTKLYHYRDEFKKLDAQNAELRQWCKENGVVFHSTGSVFDEKQKKKWKDFLIEAIKLQTGRVIK